MTPKKNKRSARARPCYLVAGCKPWNRDVFETRLQSLPGKWVLISDPAELTPALVRKLRPRYVFFLHWSWKVPDEIIAAHECVCFHMTDVPYGRGGSPLQNLIVRGHRETKLTALRMTSEFDAGPVYLKRPLSLEGGAEEILMRASALSADMIETILTAALPPQPQQGTATVFRRRKPAESAVPTGLSLGQLHDFLRMLDAEGYPKAFIEHGGFRYEFARPALYHGRIVADVTITPDKSRP